MGAHPTYIAVRKRFANLPEHMQRYFHEFENVFELSWEVVLAYIFFNLEYGQRLALYVGAVKKYKVNTEVAWAAIERAEIRKDDFEKYFQIIFGKRVHKNALDKREIATTARNRVMHGRQASNPLMREAVGAALHYCEMLDAQVFKLVKLHPIGSLQGFPGRMKLLDKATSRLIMKGLGFPLS